MDVGRHSSVLDKNHGFMKFIIKNQNDRNKYDIEQKRKKLQNVSNWSKTKGDNEHEEEVELEEEELDQVPSKLEPHEDEALFNLEFLTKFGDTINVQVKRNDSAENVAQRLVNQYPLNEALVNVLVRRIDKEIHSFSKE